MPLFGQSKDPAEVEAERARQQANLQAMIDAAGAMSQWVRGVPAGDLAAHLMPAFGPGAPARSGDGTVGLPGLSSCWVTATTPWSGRYWKPCSF